MRQSRDAYRPADADGEIVDWAIGDLLRRTARAAPERIALITPGHMFNRTRTTWTYAELLDRSERMAGFLLRHFAPGEHVAIWAANRPEWIFIQFGAALAGLVLVTINPESRAVDLRHMLTVSRASGLIYASHFRGVDARRVLDDIRADLPDLRHAFLLDELAEHDRPLPPGTLPDVPASAPAMIQFTSGTTGKAKAALLSHYGIVNVAQFTAARFAMPEGSTWMNWLPLFHTGGCVFGVLSCMWNRGALVLLRQFEPLSVLRAIEEERPRWLPFVPTTALALLDHPDRANYDLTSLEVITEGGTPIAAGLIEQLERELDVDHVIVFGQTEMSSAIALGVRNDSWHHKTATVGKPMPHTEVRIVDPVSERMLAIGEIGELQARSFATMLGYFGQSDETARVIGTDGWLRTGDLGAMHADGYLSISGRLKDMIIRGGENIYPREIEDLLTNHPAVCDVAVFGVPDSRWGERIVAAIRPRPDHRIDLTAVHQFLRPLIGRHKFPQAVWITDKMPLTLSGKIRKFTLRDAYLATIGPTADDTRAPQ